MKDIVDLNVTQVRLYPNDVLPLPALALERNLAPFREVLRFKTVSPTESKPEAVTLVFLKGEIEHEGRAHLIDELIIEAQRLTFSVFGSSAVANALYDEVRKILIAADPAGVFAKAKPYVTTEETGCIVTLDVDFRKLFSPPLLQFLEKTVRPRTSTQIATSEVVPFKFSAKLSYEILDPDLKKAGVRLLDKALTIEPRMRTRLEDRRYFTQSPTDSETHLNLLQAFEKAFGGTTKK